MKSRVFVNNKIVGFASNLDVDMPWFSADFEPLPSFAEFENLFHCVHQAYVTECFDEADQLDRKIDELHIALRMNDGIEEYATHPSGLSVAKITAVRIRGRKIMWQPV